MSDSRPTDLLAQLRESYEVETDLVSFFFEHARAFAELLIKSRIGEKEKHRMSADDAALDALEVALRYIRNKRGDPHIDREQFRALLLSIVEGKVMDQLDHLRRKKRDGRREILVEDLRLTPTELAALDRTVCRESAEKVAKLLLAEDDDEKRLINLLAYLGGYSAASIQAILRDSGYKPRSVGTISNRIKDSEKRISAELGRDLNE